MADDLSALLDRAISGFDLAQKLLPSGAGEVAQEAADPQLSLAHRVRSIRAWLGTLIEWNARMDLTAARSNAELVDLMVSDAAFLSIHMRRSITIVDVGSGAGGPGLALALLRPDLSMTLVEPLQKRISFLRTAVGVSKAANVLVERAKGEEIARGGKRFDCACSRATLKPPAWLALGEILSDEVWVLLAQEEAPPAPAEWSAEEFRYEWPLTHASRRAVRYARVTPPTT